MNLKSRYILKCLAFRALPFFLPFVAEAVALTAGGKATFTTAKYYPIVHNNPILTDRFRAAAAKVVGEGNVFPNARSMGGEDFSYFANEKPGSFMRLGVRPADKEKVPGVHNDSFNIDEGALEVGVNTYLQFILDNQNGIEF